MVTGTISDGSNSGHAWNLVKIDDCYYYVDTTWGSPGYTDAENSGIDVLYSYLCCSDSTLKPTHKAAELFLFLLVRMTAIIITKEKDVGMRHMTEPKSMKFFHRQ